MRNDDYTYQWWTDKDGVLYAVELSPEGEVTRAFENLDHLDEEDVKAGSYSAEDYIEEHDGDYVNRARYFRAHLDEFSVVYDCGKGSQP
jgi:hypothetical protein